jgi:RimJ/RimL family protein N-acetyltransferase
MVHPENLASARVVVKLGFSIEKKLPYPGLEGVDVDLYSRSI